MRDRFRWARLLAYVTGLVNQELLLRNEYLAAENRILRAHLPARLRLSDAERFTLAEIAKRLGRKALKEIARVAKPDTLLAWYGRMVAQKFDGSRCRTYPGRPRILPEVEALVVRFAKDNRGWGYDRIVGALANLRGSLTRRNPAGLCRDCFRRSDQTVHALPGPAQGHRTSRHGGRFRPVLFARQIVDRILQFR